MTAATAFPKVLDTPRLVLRCYAGAEAPGLKALVERNKDRLIRNFSPMVKSVLQGAGPEAFVAEAVEQWNARSTFHYGIWRKPSGELIGQLKIKNLQWEVPAAELSYFIDVASQRRGFATEAISAVLRTAFGKLHFRRVFVRIIDTNAESLRLAGRLGFKHEGVHRNEFRCGLGELHDVHYYALIDEDFPRIATGTGTEGRP